MNENARKARQRLAAAQAELRDAEGAVASLERNCTHRWTEPKYDPIRREGYTTPNWMGPIRGGRPALPDVYVPPETKDRWTRTCLECGKTEHTTETNQRVEHTPKFR